MKKTVYNKVGISYSHLISESVPEMGLNFPCVPSNFTAIVLSLHQQVETTWIRPGGEVDDSFPTEISEQPVGPHTFLGNLISSPR